jgi:signal transduction histidine kinase
MKLQLVSKSQQTAMLCKEVVGEIVDHNWSLHITTGDHTDPEADLYVWDLDFENEPIPAIDSHQAWRHFFLVDRSHIQVFQRMAAEVEANVIVKPVSRMALMAFLTDACRRASRERTASTVNSADAMRAERDDLLQSLMQANLRLQEYDQDRTHFLARAIHDFRAPLTALTGYCGLLLSESSGPLNENQRELLVRMQHSARKLSRMASGMFQLGVAARVEATLNLQPGDIRACVEQAVHEIVPAAGEKRVTVNAELAPADRPLHFERMRIEQVLVNLLENACRFTPRSGAIEIRGYPWFWDRRRAAVTGDSVPSERRQRQDRQPNCYRVDIRDTGPGIPPGHLSRIFEEYTSYGGGSDRSGGGLGLAICRMIVQQHKGRIWAENESQGALFSFVIPFHKEEAGGFRAQASGF